MTAVQLPQISFQEYLKIEEASETRHEYYYGEMFKKADTTIRHNDLILNTVTSLKNRLREKKCKVNFEAVKVQIVEDAHYTYPDVVVSCSAKETDKQIIKYPVLIAEILSESTSDYDRAEKFDAYQKIESLECYILIEQKRCAIECFTTRNNEWVCKIYSKIDSILEINPLNISIPLSEIYEDIAFDALLFKETFTK